MVCALRGGDILRRAGRRRVTQIVTRGTLALRRVSGARLQARGIGARSV
jgi:hypothetical protein